MSELIRLTFECVVFAISVGGMYQAIVDVVKEYKRGGKDAKFSRP